MTTATASRIVSTPVMPAPASGPGPDPHRPEGEAPASSFAERLDETVAERRRGHPFRRPPQRPTEPAIEAASQEPRPADAAAPPAGSEIAVVAVPVDGPQAVAVAQAGQGDEETPSNGGEDADDDAPAAARPPVPGTDQGDQATDEATDRQGSARPATGGPALGHGDAKAGPADADRLATGTPDPAVAASAVGTSAAGKPDTGKPEPGKPEPGKPDVAATGATGTASTRTPASAGAGARQEAVGAAGEPLGDAEAAAVDAAGSGTEATDGEASSPGKAVADPRVAAAPPAARQPAPDLADRAAASPATEADKPASPATGTGHGSDQQAGEDRSGRGSDESGQDRRNRGSGSAAREPFADRSAGRQDAFADRQAAPPPAAGPALPPVAEPAPTAQIVPAVAAAGPLTLAAEVAQKVAAQSHAPGSTVPVHGLAVSIAARAAAGSTRFDIRLDPPELGRIEVQLILDREGSIRSRMVVEKQETLDLLQRDQRNLERALAQAGLEAKEGSIEFSLKDQGGQDRERQQPGPARHWQVREAGGDPAADAAALNGMQARLAALRGGIDIRI